MFSMAFSIGTYLRFPVAFLRDTFTICPGLPDSFDTSSVSASIGVKLCRPCVPLTGAARLKRCFNYAAVLSASAVGTNMNATTV